MQNPATLYSLQFLRFIAAILVLLFHLELMKSGYKGVDIFFVISGFVMYYTTFILKPKDVITFIVNRLSKIYFLYWVAMISLFVVVPFEINLSILKTLLLIPGHSSLLGISWSLSYELYFYFIFGITAYFISEKYQRLIFLLMITIATVITFLNTTSINVKGTLFNFLAGQNLWEFLSGILCAYISCKYLKKFNPVIVILLITVSLLALIFINISYLSSYSYIIYGTLSFLTILFAVSLEYQTTINKRLTGLITLLGDSSYAIYLFSPIVTDIILPKTFSSKMSVIVLTVVFAILINQLIENNSLRIIRKNLKKSVKYFLKEN